MTQAVVSLLPSDVEKRLHDFILAGKSGSLTLHVKEGSIVKVHWQDFETIRVDRSDVRG
jgi:hypothetical protein